MNTDWKKNIAFFLTSQTVSLFGSSLVQYAILWYITLNTQSGVMMTLAIICGFVPMFLLSPFAGVWADRYSRKWLIVLSDSIIAASTLVLAILFLLGYDQMWLLFVVSELAGAWRRSADTGCSGHAAAAGAGRQTDPDQRNQRQHSGNGDAAVPDAERSPAEHGKY